MATMNRVINILIAIAIGAVAFYFVNLLQDTGGRVEPIGDLLGDTDGDGTIDLRDPCPCTAENQRRRYKGAEYCVAKQDPEEFNSMKNYFSDGEGSNVFTEDELQSKFRTVDPSDAEKVNREMVLYTADICQKALLHGQWPSRPGLITSR